MSSTCRLSRGPDGSHKGQEKYLRGNVSASANNPEIPVYVPDSATTPQHTARGSPLYVDLRPKKPNHLSAPSAAGPDYRFVGLRVLSMDRSRKKRGRVKRELIWSICRTNPATAYYVGQDTPRWRWGREEDFSRDVFFGSVVGNVWVCGYSFSI